MAKKEIVNVITIKTEESKNTIKGLREEIKNLKTTLETAEIGSDKFEQATRDLAKAQNDLKTILVDGKKKGDAIEGSYNHLAQTMAELKKEWKATADEAKRNDIGKQIDEINTQLKELDASIGNNQRNVGNYKQDFVDAMTEMKQNSFDFGQELNEVNKKTEVTRNTLDGVGKVASGVASGFAAVQGVTALLGIENKNLEKTLVKVQSAMAIAQGIGGLKGLVEGAGQLVTAFKAAKMGSAALAAQTTTTTVAMGTTATATTVATGALQTFKAALISTGVGALVVALGTLIGYLVTLGDEANDVEEDIDGMSKAFDNFQRKMENLQYKDEFVIRLKVAGGADEDEIWKERIENARKYWAESLHHQQELADSLGYEHKLYLEAVANTNKKDLELKKLKDDYLEWQTKEGKKEEDLAKDVAERARKATIDTKYEELAELKRIYEEEKQLLINHNLDTTVLTEEYYKKRKEIQEKYKTKPEIVKPEFVKPEPQKGVLDGLSNPFGETSDPYDTARQQLNQWIADRNDAIATEKQMEADKIEWMRQNYGDLFAFIQEKGGDSAGLVAAGFMEALYSASAIIGAIQEGIDTTTKEGFEKNKKLQIANAVIQTLVGVTTALSGAFTTKSGPWDIALAAIQASTIATTGAIQVANIKKQTYNGGSEGDIGNAAAAPRLDLSSTMPVQYTRDLLTDSEMSNMNQEQKVYVTETDITNTQNKVKVSESNASF